MTLRWPEQQTMDLQQADLQWADRISDSAIRAAVGSAAHARGAEYARTGRVHQVTGADGQALLGTVRGSGGRTYSTLVVPAQASPAGAPRWAGRCTCPVSVDCKHVVAVLLAARRAVTVRQEKPRPAWEGAVADIVRGAPGPQDEDVSLPLALQVELAPAVGGCRQPSGRGTASPGGRLVMRPVTRGKNGGWVRTGVSWRDFEHDHGFYGRTRPAAAQREGLRELYAVFRARSGGYYSYGDQPVSLDGLGRAAWQLLGQLVDAGIQLVPARAAQGPVRLAQAPASLALDLRRVDPRSGATLDAVVAVEGATLDVAAVRFVGDPAHGLFLDGSSPGAPREGPAGGGLLLAPLDRPVDERLTRLLDGGRRVEIPAPDVDRFLHRYYPGLRQVVTVTSSDDSVALPEVEPPRLALTLTYGSDHALALDWAFAYALGGDVEKVPLRGPAGAAVVRDPVAEQGLLAGLDLPVERLPQLHTDVAGQMLLAAHVEMSGMDTATFTLDVLPGLCARDDVVVEVVGAPAEYRHTDAAPLVQVSATDSGEDPDWFDLGVTVSVDGQEVPFHPLFVALARGQSHLLLADGTVVGIDRPELQQLRELISEARDVHDRERDGLRISRFQAALWEELTELGVVQAQSERWTRSVQGLLDVDQLAPPPEPGGLRADLRPYQREGYHWLSFLREQELGGILADDMGLGKTVQTLAMISRAVETGAATAPFLVVAPTSVVPNWANEAARFTPGLRVATVTATQSRRGEPLSVQVDGAHVVVTSYALFRIDCDAYADVPWGGLVLDEAQFVKNHQSKAYQCARRLPAPFKLAITGTPLENNLMELWSLLSIVAPGLYPSPQRFSELYAKPIQRGEPERLATLRRRIRPLMRRRTKEQVAAELPPKQEQVLEVALNPRHQRIYQTHLQRERQKVLGLIDDLDKNRFAIFRSLTLLRQLSLDPGLVDDAYDGVRSSKVDALVEHLGEVAGEGHRALVFSQFTGFLRTVRDRLDAEGIPYSYLDGRTRNREKRIEEFKTGTAPVFLISLKAGGFGLNLTEADYVFVLDPWWNPAVEAQAVDRTHRIGQDKTVMVYRLVSTGTIEEKVMELKERKMGLFSRVMDDDALLSAPLTVDDITGLLDPVGS